MSFGEILKKITDGTSLSVILENGVLKIYNPDYDLYPGFEFTKNGIIVSCSAFGHSESVLLTWEEVECLKETLKIQD
jgi:hypothetical protein